EKAAVRVEQSDPVAHSAGAPRKVATPGKKSAEEVAEFLGVPLASVTKTMIFDTEKGLVAAVVRGDHEVNPVKLKSHLGVDVIELADEAKVAATIGARAGSLGPVGLPMDVCVDFALAALRDFVTGANADGFHLTGVQHGRDFEPTAWADLRAIAGGDPCPKCAAPIAIRRGIEVGHVFRLGTKYSESMDAHFLDADGESRPMIMGCYGIGIGRTAAAAIEQNHDERGIAWPVPLAPFQVHFILVNLRNEALVAAATRLHDELESRGVEVLLDDRDERAGVKFAEADLLGCPWRVTLGPKQFAEGNAELKARRAAEAEIVPLEGLADRLADSVRLALEVAD
ncbi:MAG: proline--tRNA ligase, partial [Myxococcales bacterium]|nr:proline--tRNA ligase [Myxococcales bacterium]